MTTNPADKWNVTVGSWGTDIDRNTTLSNVVGDSCLEFKSGGIAQIESGMRPVEGGSPYTMGAIVYATSVAVGKNVRVRFMQYADDKTTFLGSFYGVFDKPLDTASTWEYQSTTFNTLTSTRYIKAQIQKLATGFTFYLDHIYGSKAPIAFSAYRSSARNMASGVNTNIIPNTENYDYGSNYSTANGRFTAPRAMRMHLSASFNIQLNNGNRGQAFIYKNGALFAVGNSIIVGGSGGQALNVSRDIELAKGDYVEFWGYQGTGSTQAISTGNQYTYFTGHEIR